jgi:hypothetical protein
MSELPTAKDFFKEYADLVQHEESFIDAMKEFAKLHIEAVLYEIEIQRCLKHYPPINFISKGDLLKNIK